MGASASSTIPDILLGLEPPVTSNPEKLPVTNIVIGMPGRGKSRFLSHMLNLKIYAAKGRHGRKGFLLWSMDEEDEAALKDEWRKFFRDEFVTLSAPTDSNGLSGHTQHCQVHAVDDLRFMDTPGVEVGHWTKIAEEMNRRIQNTAGPVRFIFFCEIDAERVSSQDVLMINKIIEDVEGVSSEEIAKSSVVVLNGHRRNGWIKWPFSSPFEILEKSIIAEIINSKKNALMNGIRMIFAENSDAMPDVGMIVKISSYDEKRPDGGLIASLLNKIDAVQPIKITNFNFNQGALDDTLMNQTGPDYIGDSS